MEERRFSAASSVARIWLFSARRSDITNVIRIPLSFRANICLMNSPIDLKHVIARIPYKIEPKPDGGFIARASDPMVAPIEAPTREELHQKILAAVSSQFSELGIPAGGKNVHVSFKINTGKEQFSVSTIPNEAPGPEQGINIANLALDKLLSFAAKHLSPELAEQMTKQGITTSFNLTVSNKTAVQVNSGPQGLTFAGPKSSVVQNKSSDIPQFEAGVGLIDGQPITPEPSNIGKILKLIVCVMILGVLAYLYLLSRH